MHTILVLTDFSDGAKNGADLALQLAGKLQARLLLVHVYQSTIKLKVNDPASYPLEEQLSIQQDPDRQLQQEALRLARLQLSMGTAQLPDIETCSFLGSFKAGLKFIAAKNDIFLAIVGDHHQASDLFNPTDHVKISEQYLNYPLLVMPAGRRGLRSIKHIALATDLAKKDLQALTWLQKLAEKLNCQLFTGHISLPAFNMPAAEEEAAGIFMAGMEKLGLPLHDYQNYYAENVVAAINEFGEARHADILAVVYKKHSRLWHWLHGSTTEALLAEHSLPLLLIPGL